MSTIAGILNTLFDLLTPVFAGNFWVPLVLTSAIAGVLLVWLFKVTTDQDQLVARRHKLLGHLYELGLYQDNLVTIMRVQKDLLIANLRYLRVSLPALLVLLPITVIVLVQLESRFERSTLQPGDQFLVEAVVTDPAILDQELQLQSNGDVEILAGPLVNRADNSAWWRVKIISHKPTELAIVSANGSVTKNLAGGNASRFATSREQSGWHYLTMNPTEAAIPADAFLQTLTLHLRQQHSTFLGLRWWFWIFCGTSMIIGLLFKNILGVKL
ncbi:hypothetical protein HOD41_01395 [bacterium]|jgi:hypothetical protein|nr:hypothetical protein [bacterium]